MSLFIGRVRSFFYPEVLVDPAIRSLWKSTSLKAYLDWSSKVVVVAGILSCLHCIFVDLPMGFKTPEMFLAVRFSVSFFSVVITLLRRFSLLKVTWKSLHVLFYCWFFFSELLLFRGEERIPFFILFIFLIFSLICMGLSPGWSLVTVTAFFLGSAPWIDRFPVSDLPASLQFASLYLVSVLIVIAFRCFVYKDIKIFNLNFKSEKLREALMLEEKFSALGKMASGIAHEVLNSLSVAKNSLELIAEKKEEFPKKHEKRLNRVDRSVDHAIEVCRGVKVYAGLETFTLEDLDLVRLVEEQIELISGSFKEGVSCSLHLPQQSVAILGNSAAIRQVVSNLVNNSMDAISGKGWIRVTIGVEHDFAELIFEDSGSGIPDKISGCIFDPFFTTKDIGVGTGLGLSIVKGVVHKHGGAIELCPSVTGSKFLIRIPLKK